MKCYVLMISRVYPKGHPKAGQPTYFDCLIENAMNVEAGNEPMWAVDERTDYIETKFHTIRGNPEMWKKRFEQIFLGKAYLSLRIWEGKPYHSKQIELDRFDRDDGIGMQILKFCKSKEGKNSIIISDINYPESFLHTLAKNDGMTTNNFTAYMKLYKPLEPLAIIHLTKFRY